MFLGEENDSAQSDDEKREGKGRIRVGGEYQAVLPEHIQPSDRVEEDMCSERGMLVWSPSMLGDEEMDKYVHTAFDKYGYNSEQALALLFWHKHNMDRAMQDLANFTPSPSEWSTNDKILFEQALKIQGKRFQLIQQMLPEKTIGSLVQHYYGRVRSTVGDSSTKKLAMVREEPVPGAEKMVEGEDPSQQRMFGSFSPLPTLARRGESAGVGQRYSQGQTAGPGQ